MYRDGRLHNSPRHILAAPIILTPSKRDPTRHIIGLYAITAGP